MCGILALLAHVKTDETKDLKLLLELIDKRGPDYSSPLIELATNCGVWLKLKSSILHLRGETLQEQPVTDEDGNVLLFNGQIYQHAGRPIERYQSDTTYLSKELTQCKSPLEVLETFAEIDGPFAFIFWHNRFRKLFYGRDLFGRKSLCMLKPHNSHPIILSSVVDERLEQPDRKWEEVSCDGLHCIDFSAKEHAMELLFPWNLKAIYPRTERCLNPPDITLGGARLEISLLRPLNCDLAEPCEFDEHTRNSTLELFETKFIEAVRSRYKYNRSDCLICRKEPRYSAVTKKVICRDSKVMVAFSGGIDSTMIAMALDKVMDIKETIDLVTVSFKDDSPDRESVGSAFKELRALRPSRRWRLILCDISKIELQRERDRQIRDLILPCDTVFDDSIGCASWFVGRANGRAIDSTIDDQWISKHFDQFLKYNPYNTDLDQEINIDYKSPASMIFVGTSIDEQLGGYSSHRKAWSTNGIVGLYKEVSFLMRRISSRNLGRDDRVYSHHGRDVKLPFLDSQFVSFLNELPMGLKMNLNEPLEIGPKKILRELALKWNLNETGHRVKRAMQFGTRIANLEKAKEKANDVCLRLRPKYQDPILIDLTD
uniref:Asparagine synthetase domain-containing protein 1 n=1 Tax=Aceria tosichella TaxID=561515 RepID=A0A6G1SH02_9ACAR